MATVAPFSKFLAKLEDEKTKAYDDLIKFFCAYFEEWGAHYPEYQPQASAEDRQNLRKNSFALANIIFFPLFRIAFEFWFGYRETGVDWNKEKGWKNALAVIAGETKMIDPETGNEINVEIMSKSNPGWQGRILIRKMNSKGEVSWRLSSTRDTRESAYSYLCEQAKLKLSPVKISKGKGRAPVTKDILMQAEG